MAVSVGAMSTKQKQFPVTWKEAEAWCTVSNSNPDNIEQPEWSFDCGFKLDFDGPIVSVSSRFYPPGMFDEHPDTWEGDATLMVLDKAVAIRTFEAGSIDQLRAMLVDWVDSVAFRIISNFELDEDH